MAKVVKVEKYSDVESEVSKLEAEGYTSISVATGSEVREVITTRAAVNHPLRKVSANRFFFLVVGACKPESKSKAKK